METYNNHQTWFKDIYPSFMLLNQLYILQTNKNH